jgi:ABC-type transport system involved in multi-copper enzyme maturation permease subunit
MNMPIHESTYSSWGGRTLEKPRTWLIIAKTGARLVWRKSMALLLFVATIPFLVRAGQIYLSSKLPDDESIIDLAAAIEVDEKLFMNFMRDQMIVLLVLLAVCGAGLIANDRRFKALSLYFSRPVSFWDYVIGKFVIIFFYGSLITILPALLLYGLQLLVTVEPGFFGNYYWVPFSILVQGAIVLIVLSALLLALSSLARGTRSSIVAFFALITIPAFMVQLLSSIKDIGWISVTRNLRQLSEVMYGQAAPYRYPLWAAVTAWVVVVAVSVLVLRKRIKPTEVVK